MSRGYYYGVLLGALLLTGCEVGTEPPTAGASAGDAQTQSGQPNSLFPTTGGATASTHGGQIPFVHGFQAGYAQALSTGKPMLVFFTASWCTYCHQMADDAFTNPAIVALADHFTCIMVDADAEPDVCRKFRVQGYPTVQFLSQRGAALQRLVGKKPADEVVLAMQSALQNVARKSDPSDVRSR